MRKAFQVPTTDDARTCYTVGRDEMDGAWDIDSQAEFDRWLALVKAQAKVAALREQAVDFYYDGEREWDGYAISGALTIDADRIAREAGIDNKGESK